jgi:hypothetical protein
VLKIAYRLVLYFLSAILLSIFALDFCLASGSYEISSSGNDPTNEFYDLGKSTFHRKITCSSCPLHQDEMDGQAAKSIIQKLSSTPDIVPTLSDNERDAVFFYLQKRYEIKTQ